MAQVEVDELDAAGALVAFGDLRAARDAAERDIFVLAAHVADLYSIDADAHGRLKSLKGGQRALPLGGDGAPLVWEFAVAEIAAELHVTTGTARRLVADALAVRHRLPRLWSRVHHQTVPPWRARLVAQATRELTPAQALVVDDRVAEYADGRLPYARFLAKVEAEVLAADPEAATARERRAAQEEFAKVGQTNTHGRKTLYVKSSAAEMTRIEATISHLAEALRVLGDTDHEDRRRTKAVLIMANPIQAIELLQALRAARSRTDDHTGDTGNHAGAADGPGEPPWDQDEPLPEDLFDDPPDDLPGEPPADPSTGAGPSGARPTGGAGTGDVPTDRPPEPPAGSAEASRRPFLAPFRPDQVPPCACQSPWTHDPARLLPGVTLYLHVHADTLRAGNGVVRWEGEGPISWAYVRNVLGPRARFVVKPVIDPATLPAVDAYETPERLREGLHLRTPFDVFPYAPNTSRRLQADHTQPYQPQHQGGKPGQTGLHNLGPMTGFHHRTKTHGGWQVAQPFPGIYLWLSPHGSVFLVDNTGTRQVRRPQPTGHTRTDLGPPGQSPPTTALARIIDDWVA